MEIIDELYINDVSHLEMYYLCVSHLEMYYLCTFGVPGRRPDARRVSKARPLSQDQQDADLAVRHLSILMQDCWSQYRTVHSYIRGWYLTDHHLRLPRQSIDTSKKSISITGAVSS